MCGQPLRSAVKSFAKSTSEGSLLQAQPEVAKAADIAGVIWISDRSFGGDIATPMPAKKTVIKRPTTTRMLSVGLICIRF